MILIIYAFSTVLLFLLFTLYGKPDFYIIENFRIPRNLTAFLCGGSLAVAGAVYQVSLKNPLADPYILGVAGFSLVGYIIGEFLLVPTVGVIFFSLVGLLFIIYASRKLPPKHLILAGVGINAFCVSFILILYSLMDPYNLKEAVTRTIGIVPYLSLRDTVVILVLTSVLLIFLISRSKRLDALLMGELEAVSLGVKPSRERAVSLTLSTVLSSIFVSIVGMVGFIGLVIPHLIRFLYSSLHSKLLPLSFLTGGAVFMCADFFSRRLLYPSEIPAGVFSSLFLSPLFIFILWRYRND